MPGMSKAELFEVVVNAVGESGWNVLYIAPPSTHPFHMQVYRGEEGYRLCIYIWTLTHERSTDETHNGLALCTLHHRAYDQALITMDENYAVVFNKAQAVELGHLGLAAGVEKFKENLRSEILVPDALSDRPHVDYIRLANRIRGWP